MKSGVTPPGNEGVTEHADPRSKGTGNSPENAAHPCRDYNEKFGDSSKERPSKNDDHVKKNEK